MKPKRGRPRKIYILPRVLAPRKPKINLSSETKRSLAIVLSVALAVLATLSLLNISGSAGIWIVKIFKTLLGWGAFLLPIFFILIAASLYKDVKEEAKSISEKSSTHVYLGVALFTLLVISFLQLTATRDLGNQIEIAKLGNGGGWLGAIIALGILKTIGPWAGFILLALGALAAILITFNLSLKELFNMFSRGGQEKLEAKPNKEGSVKINAPLENGFKEEPVGNANPVATALAKQPVKNIPKFLNNKPAAVAKPITSAPLPNRTIVNKDWPFPPVNLLEESNATVDSGNIEANVAIIQKTLADFDIEVEMGEVNVGPTVTQYTLRPADGVRLSAIVALQNDLKLALSATSIRIEAPIPGKSLVGIEIPNKTTAVVRLRELFEIPEFQNHHSPLAFVLGRDVAGKGILEDLGRMPHLLIAGATGSGKSVCMNVVLTSFLMRNAPEDVKFIIIDPKRVEMSLYNEVPHLITPVIIDHQKAVNALRWTVAEMDRRYHLLAEAHKRNITEYNEVSPHKMSYLVVIVDELADLMAVARNDVEATIVRLAQMARAVGIHLILATQRPSVDIITGLIKANITSRIAFAVASQVDSRTILDQAGAEKLLGRGDMLYITAEMSQPRRIQGALISEKEVKKITDFLRKEGQPTYNESVTEKVRVSSIETDFNANDGEEPLLEEAKAIVTQAGKASASLLQRRLRIGYARAARILDILEEHGMVGPAEGAKPREVYMAGNDQIGDEGLDNNLEPRFTDEKSI